MSSRKLRSPKMNVESKRSVISEGREYHFEGDAKRSTTFSHEAGVIGRKEVIDREFSLEAKSGSMSVSTVTIVARTLILAKSASLL